MGSVSVAVNRLFTEIHTIWRNFGPAEEEYLLNVGLTVGCVN